MVPNVEILVANLELLIKEQRLKMDHEQDVLQRYKKERRLFGLFYLELKFHVFFITVKENFSNSVLNLEWFSHTNDVCGSIQTHM
jgi:hypothetical protein